MEAGSDIDNYRKACRANTKLLYGETICNPMMWLLDIKGLANIGQELGVMTMVDATFSSPINQVNHYLFLLVIPAFLGQYDSYTALLRPV